jgi:hypothetical protein
MFYLNTRQVEVNDLTVGTIVVNAPCVGLSTVLGIEKEGPYVYCDFSTLKADGTRTIQKRFPFLGTELVKEVTL